MSQAQNAQRSFPIQAIEQCSKTGKNVKDCHEKQLSSQSTPCFDFFGKTDSGHQSHNLIKNDNSHSNNATFQQENVTLRNNRDLKPISNKRLQFITACLIGQPVEVQVKNGSIYSGIFYTANAEKDYGVILRMARLITDRTGKGRASDPLKACGKSSHMNMLIIPGNDLVQMVAKDFALSAKNFANICAQSGKNDIATDSLLSSGHCVPMTRELEPWTPDNDIPEHLGLEDTFENTLNRSWDQFEANETLFGVKTTYDEEIYTTKLERGPHTRDREREAARIAREIEEQSTDNLHLAEERGLHLSRGTDLVDEEARYSSVLRQNYDDNDEDDDRLFRDSYNNVKFSKNILAIKSSPNSSKKHGHIYVDELQKQPACSSLPPTACSSKTNVCELEVDSTSLNQNIENIQNESNRQKNGVSLKNIAQYMEKKDDGGDLQFSKDLFNDKIDLSHSKHAKSTGYQSPLKVSDKEHSSLLTRDAPVLASGISSPCSSMAESATAPPASALPMPVGLSNISIISSSSPVQEHIETSDKSINQGIPKPKTLLTTFDNGTSPDSTTFSMASSRSESSSHTSLVSTLSNMALNQPTKEFKLNPNAKSFVPASCGTRCTAGAESSSNSTTNNLPMTHVQALQSAPATSLTVQTSQTINFRPYSSFTSSGVAGTTYLQSVSGYPPTIPGTGFLPSFSPVSTVDAPEHQYSQHLVPGQVFYMPAYSQDMFQGPPPPQRLVPSFARHHQSQQPNNEGPSS